MGDEGEATSVDQSAQSVLARRLNLLMDVVVAERGTPVTFREVQDQLAAQGISLSRARWFYMKDGTGRLVSDRRLLSAICEIFGVDPAYLLGESDSELPQRIDSQLEFVKSLRAARVKSFAARTLGDVSPETLRAITEYLNRDIQLHPEGEQAAAIPPAGSEGELPAAP
ncbi:hypothetical protein [Arthrobacter sp. 35W]|uniref:hypothetical protein n=1 Tax=Arthrobacter sp. 35W TaxID=1132441 RepID=UPI00041F0D72|nr:hypothetical protein [Arthrobacter sp. 35W]